MKDEDVVPLDGGVVKDTKADNTAERDSKQATSNDVTGNVTNRESTVPSNLNCSANQAADVVDASQGDRSASGGHGRGRGRGRGRKVAPRAVPRKKPPTRVVTSVEGGSSGSGTRGKGPRRGRGDSRGGGANEGRGLGRGAGRGSAPQYEPGVIGLGQIAPQRVPVSTVSQGSGTSRRSSGMATQSSGGGQSFASGISMGSLGTTGNEGTPSSGPGICDDFNSSSHRVSAGGINAAAMSSTDLAFENGLTSGLTALTSTSRFSNQTIGENSDTDDDLPEGDIERRHYGIANYVGTVFEGLLPPVSLPPVPQLPSRPSTESSLSQKGYSEDPDPDEEKADDQNTFRDDCRRASKHPMNIFPSNSQAKVEPMELPMELSIDDDSRVQDREAASAATSQERAKQADPLLFPSFSPARYLLTAEKTPLFLQLPGLLPLVENSDAWHDNDAPGTEHAPADDTVGDNQSKARDAGAVGTDLRRVGKPGEAERIGKLRLYKSGRVELVFSDGTVYDVENGAECRSAQQLVCVNLGASEDKTCEELCSSLRSRLVCSPSLSSLVSSGHSLPKKES